MDEQKTRLYYNADEVMNLLGVSRGKAYQIIRELNEELTSRGFITVSGKVPKKYFNERFYGVAVGE